MWKITTTASSSGLTHHEQEPEVKLSPFIVNSGSLSKTAADFSCFKHPYLTFLILLHIYILLNEYRSFYSIAAVRPSGCECNALIYDICCVVAVTLIRFMLWQTDDTDYKTLITEEELERAH